MRSNEVVAINPIAIEFVRVEGGAFTMGGEEEDARPHREVEVGSFLMSRYPITQEQWGVASLLPLVRYRMGQSSPWWGQNIPVTNVCWLAAVEFCDRLSAKAGRIIRLPSEAEWEYACRAGTRSRFSYGESCDPSLVAAGLGMPVPVGSCPPNDWGLFDMQGGVWEWCLDDWHPNYDGAPTDSSPWVSGARKVVRGGCWESDPQHCRSGFRGRAALFSSTDSVGFRVVMGEQREDEVFAG